MKMERLFAALPEIETERLLLRRIVRSDLHDVFAYASNEAVAKHVLWSAHRTLWDSRDFIRSQRYTYRHALPCSWGIIWKATSQLIGTVGYVSYSPDHYSAEVGYSLSQDFWHQGIMTEALRTVTDFSFQETDVNRLQAIVETDNPASAQVLRHCGFQQEGLLHEYVLNKGRNSDVFIFGLTRRQWGELPQ